MTTRYNLLEKLRILSKEDPERYPVVTLDDYFSENDDEESIAPNNWGYGRPSIKEIYSNFKKVEERSDVQGVYVGMHNDWTESLDKDDLWPAAENIHIISSATQEEANKWIEGMKADGIGLGWPYRKHKLSPEPPEGYVVYTVYWD